MKHLKKFESFKDIFLGSSKENEEILKKWNKELDFILNDDMGQDLLIGCEDQIVPSWAKHADDRVINLHYFESEDKMNVRNPFYRMGGRETAPESAVLRVAIPKSPLKRIQFYWSSDADFDDPNIINERRAIEFSSSSDLAKEVIRKLEYILDYFPDKKPFRRIYR